MILGDLMEIIGKVKIIRDLDTEEIEPRLLRVIKDYLEFPGDGYCEFEDQMLVCAINTPKVAGNLYPEVELVKTIILIDPATDALYIYQGGGDAPLEIATIKSLEKARDHGEAFQEILSYLADRYNKILSSVQEAIDRVEDMIESEDLGSVVKATYILRRSLINIRRGLKNFVQMLKDIHSDHKKQSFVKNQHLLLELIDEASISLETLEIHRETLITLREAHASLLGLRLNEIVKRLTAITLVLMIPTLIASIYGMNFDRSYPLNMPELSWSFGYIYALTLMAISSIAGYLVLKARGWF